MRVDQEVANLSSWLQKQVEAAGAQGVTFGLSGGLDSAVVAGLAVRALGSKALGLILPCESAPEDREDALLVAKTFNLPVREYDLTPIFRQFSTVIGDFVPNRLAQANLKARLRMNTLYLVANHFNSLVVGTSNLSEITVGYFTKWGDSACDLWLLANYSKGQVRQLAQALQVPERILNKVPTAGLWPGQTDESELGVSYQEIEAYLKDDFLPLQVKRRIRELSAKNEHKRRFPPSPEQDI